LPFVVKACSIAFRSFPNVNAVMDEERMELVVRGAHNIGVACDTPQGLFVPVIKNVQNLSILQIATAIDDLVARTRAGKARVDELIGNTGGIFATPILNVPEVAIMGFNVIRPRPMVVDGQIVVRQMTVLSPSFDHRIIDGAVGARFTAAVRAILENPESLLLELV
jgi:pyruvate dehydrogenase E2 component (dihydrolipoamide acetyltransferase)